MAQPGFYSIRLAQSRPSPCALFFVVSISVESFSPGNGLSGTLRFAVWLVSPGIRRRGDCRTMRFLTSRQDEKPGAVSLHLPRHELCRSRGTAPFPEPTTRRLERRRGQGSCLMSLGQMFLLEVIHTENGFDKIREEWTDLLAHSSSDCI